MKGNAVSQTITLSGRKSVDSAVNARTVRTNEMAAAIRAQGKFKLIEAFPLWDSHPEHL